MRVYILSHSYPVGKDKFYDEVRYIGVFSSKKKAIEALKEYKTIKGFKSHLAGFFIEGIEVNKNFQWKEGYSTIYYD